MPFPLPLDGCSLQHFLVPGDETLLQDLERHLAVVTKRATVARCSYQLNIRDPSPSK